MPLINWKSEFSVGIKHIDDQHKKLIGIINKLDTAIGDGTGGEEILNTISELKSYSNYHFASEERLMKNSSFPNYKIHKMEHDAFVKTINEFEFGVKNNKEHLTTDVMDFLSKWFENHVLYADKDFFLNNPS